MAETIDDAEIKKALALAGVPLKYQKKEVRLEGAGDVGKRIAKWLKAGKARGLSSRAAFLEILEADAEDSEAFYLMVRAMVLRRVPVVVLDAEQFKPPFDEDFYERVSTRKVLALDGLVTEGRKAFTPEEVQSMEWFLLRWLGQGRSIIMLNEWPALEGNEHTPFSQRFARRVLKHAESF